VIATHGNDLRPGDAFLLNSPYHGGTHLPDMTVVTPCSTCAASTCTSSRLRAAHHADIGGTTPGSMPPGSRDIAEEGVLITPTRIVRDGRFEEDTVRALLAAGPWPARNVEQNLADLRAQLAANARGIRELERAAAAHGWPALLAYMAHVQDNGEACMRRAIRNLADGRFRYEMDNGQAIEVSVTVDRAAGTARVDFTGTSAQQASNLNAPRAVTIAAVLYVFRTLVAEQIPINAGCLRPLTIVVPPGTLLDPVPPGAVVAGNVETVAVHRRRTVRRTRSAGRRPGNDEQFHVRQRPLPVLRDHRRRGRRGPGLRRRERRADAHDQFAAHDPEVLEARFRCCCVSLHCAPLRRGRRLSRR